MSDLPALLITVLASPVLLAVAIVAIARERTDRRISRRRYLFWVLIANLGNPLLLIGGVQGLALGTKHGSPAFFAIGAVLFIAGTAMFYISLQQAVQRSRDAGHDKKLAWLLLLPIINVVAFLALALLPSRAAGQN